MEPSQQKPVAYFHSHSSIRQRGLRRILTDFPILHPIGRHLSRLYGMFDSVFSLSYQPRKIKFPASLSSSTILRALALDFLSVRNIPPDDIHRVRSGQPGPSRARIPANTFLLDPPRQAAPRNAIPILASAVPYSRPPLEYAANPFSYAYSSKDLAQRSLDYHIRATIQRRFALINQNQPILFIIRNQTCRGINTKRSPGDNEHIRL